MLSINTNLSSLIAQRSMKQSTLSLNTAIERMTTGFKINHSKDNAANYSICTNMDTKIGALQVAEDNCAMGLDMLATANGTLDQISDKLQRLRNLAVQASNGTYGEQSKQAINAEANALVDEIERLYNTTEYNGMKLFYDSKVETQSSITEAILNNSLVSGGTYTISTVEELEALANFVNTGNDTSGMTFELNSDIDLVTVSSWTPIGNETKLFKGIFNGNGHVIKNLKINASDVSYVGLFGNTALGSEIKNLGIEDAFVESYYTTGGIGVLVGYSNSLISNCYVTGYVQGDIDVGGLVGVNNASVVDCYATTDIVLTFENAGGLVGTNTGSIERCYTTGHVGYSGMGVRVGGIVGVNSGTINNCYATGDTSGDIYGHFSFTGENRGIISNSYSTGSLSYGFTDNNGGTVINCASVLSDSKTTQMSEDEIKAFYSYESMGFIEDNGWTIGADGNPVMMKTINSRSRGSMITINSSRTINLQIGINSDSNSQISVNTSLLFNSIDELRNIGVDLTTDYLNKIDKLFIEISKKQTQFGAIENSLNSALEEISTQYENLVSSRSTLRDADIADVSSTYIQQQILQQASATLLSTANQSPSIALQLI